MYFDKHKQFFIQTYSNISFSPERRGEQDVKDFNSWLEKDLLELGEKQGNYREKFISKVLCYMSRKGRTASSFICGPANFPVARNRKRIDAEQRAWEDFTHWRKKYFQAVNRVKTPTPEEEIDSAIASISRLIDQQTKAKETNVIIRKYKLCEGLGRDQAPDVSKYTEHQKEGLNKIIELWGNLGNALKILTPDFLGRQGIPDYALTSLSTKIRERKKKIEIMKTRIDRRDNFEDLVFDGGKVTIENDRVCIYHDTKPSKEVIEQIKGKGFRWSPNWKCWCRKHTGNAIYDAKNLYKGWSNEESK